MTVSVGGSTGVGVSYLPLLLMQSKKLLEKQAALRGVNVTMAWQRFPTPGPMYHALLSGRLDFASGGVTQLLASWDKTRTTARIKGVGALEAMPLELVTSNVRIRTVRDFRPDDRIAVPAVRTSIQAVILAMAAGQAFGPGDTSRFEPLEVSLGHPEATAALLSGGTTLDAHFSAAPFMYQELAAPGIHEVLDSNQVLGGPHTYNCVWATSSFHDAHPKVFAAFVAALREALDEIRSDPAAATAIWLRAEPVQGMSVAQAEAIIRKPKTVWTIEPQKFMAFTRFMHRTGLISTAPGDWHALFFDDVTSGG